LSNNCQSCQKLSKSCQKVVAKSGQKVVKKLSPKVVKKFKI
jgi:hypothetical protein